jgi:hypothetical protein
MASAAAERKLTDASAELEKGIRDIMPQGIHAHFALLARMQPRESFQAAATERFAQEPPFSTVLTGIADFAKVTVKALASKLPAFHPEEHKEVPDAPAAEFR